MSEFLSNAVVLLLLVAAISGLVAWVRRDTFTGRQYRQPSVPEKPTHDELQRIPNVPLVGAGVLRVN